ncbi:Hypothetical predicted protein [Podarcis lilfordi]|uniref:Uncharacterized protein n=1 Tax=Podarcis lilfordi TaxID=74358 RepID=A0AA35LEZ3_9SAUR|nr:Hypothetical predicted protein [Podarcis lilfordi]
MCFKPCMADMRLEEISLSQGSRVFNIDLSGGLATTGSQDATVVYKLPKRERHGQLDYDPSCMKIQGEERENSIRFAIQVNIKCFCILNPEHSSKPGEVTLT